MNDNLKFVRTLQARGSITSLIAALVLAGCVTTAPYSGEDVALAAQQGSLEQLYADVEQALQRASPGTENYTSLMLVRNDVVHRLSAPHLEQIDGLLDGAKEAPLSLPELAKLDAEIATIKPWKPLQAEDFETQAGTLRAATEQDITALSAEISGLTASQVGKRYVASMRLAFLEGGEGGEQRRAQVTQELEQTYDEALVAVQKKQLPEAQSLLGEVAYAEPQYREVVYNQGLVATGLFEQHFWQALVDGQPEKAYAVFYDFAQTPAFETHRNQVALDAGDLAEYFDTLGDTARRQGKWLESYRAFQKASFVRISLQLPLEPSQGLNQFLNEMERRYQAADRRGAQSAAFAYLSVIESLYPAHSLLGDNKRARQDEVREQAAVKLSLDRFQGEYGSEVSSAIRESLLDSGLRQVRLVSDAQLSADSEGQSAYVLMGETRGAEVRRQQEARQESRSVAVGRQPGPNPEYAAWKDLPKSERVQVAEPPKAANLSIYEYVTLTYNEVTSLGELGADFQLLDSLSGDVRLQDLVEVTSIEEGTEIAAVTQGGFTQPAVAAAIPTEQGQMEALAGDVASMITERLANWFLALDRHYIDQAKTFDEENKRAAATDSWAFAYVVSDPESENYAYLRTSMQEAAVSM
jgi:hypothetical protein